MTLPITHILYTTVSEEDLFRKHAGSIPWNKDEVDALNTAVAQYDQQQEKIGGALFRKNPTEPEKSTAEIAVHRIYENIMNRKGLPIKSRVAIIMYWESVASPNVIPGQIIYYPNIANFILNLYMEYIGNSPAEYKQPYGYIQRKLCEECDLQGLGKLYFANTRIRDFVNTAIFRLNKITTSNQELKDAANRLPGYGKKISGQAWADFIHRKIVEQIPSDQPHNNLQTFKKAADRLLFLLKNGKEITRENIQTGLENFPIQPHEEIDSDFDEDFELRGTTMPALNIGNTIAHQLAELLSSGNALVTEEDSDSDFEDDVMQSFWTSDIVHEPAIESSTAAIVSNEHAASTTPFVAMQPLPRLRRDRALVLPIIPTSEVHTSYGSNRWTKDETESFNEAVEEYNKTHHPRFRQNPFEKENPKANEAVYELFKSIMIRKGLTTTRSLAALVGYWYSIGSPDVIPGQVISYPRIADFLLDLYIEYIENPGVTLHNPKACGYHYGYMQNMLCEEYENQQGIRKYIDSSRIREFMGTFRNKLIDITLNDKALQAFYNRSNLSGGGANQLLWMHFVDKKIRTLAGSSQPLSPERYREAARILLETYSRDGVKTVSKLPRKRARITPVTEE